MKALLIGGTGTISSSVTALCLKKGWDVTLLNRGSRNAGLPDGVHTLCCDINDEAAAAKALDGLYFDVVAQFVAYTPDQVRRDIRLFTGKTAQYIFISSASAYQKPPAGIPITESTPLYNPYWQYSRDKAACEDVLTAAGRESGFPFTVVRPSHTYCERSVPVYMHGSNGSWAVVTRIRDGRKVIVPGDGSTLWTLTHSRDFAVAFEGLMGNVHAIGDCYHITSDESLTWNQVYECIGRAVGRAPQIVHIPTDTICRAAPSYVGALKGDKSNTVIFDNSKIKRAVPAFRCDTRFDQGVRECIDFIDAHPEYQKTDEAFDRWCDEMIAAYEKMEEGLPTYEG